MTDTPRPRDFHRFIGIHLGGGRGKTTAVARLERSGNNLRLAEARVRQGHRGGGEGESVGAENALFRDEVLVSYLDRWHDANTVVAVNAPLTLPPCIRCQLACPGVSACEVPVVRWMRNYAHTLDPRKGRSDPGKPAVTPYTQRAVDLLFAHGGLKPRESLGQGMGPLSARAAYLRRALSPRLRLHENLIEVHPPATVIRLFGQDVERGIRLGDSTRVWELRKRVLRDLPCELDYVWPEAVVRSPHIFESVICAWTAALWANHSWHGPTDLLPQGGDELEKTGPLAPALEAFAQLWLEDGWIWAPPNGEAKAS